jgi:hypothetical protein
LLLVLVDLAVLFLASAILESFRGACVRCWPDSHKLNVSIANYKLINLYVQYSLGLITQIF